MLALKPNCECCNKDLPPDTSEARICSYECTFCANCVETRLNGICPNCGGNFVPRPIRPMACLAKHPASTERVIKSHTACAPTTGHGHRNQ
ncbi:DUF1272 domain-containing protein [Tateyamaria omphalii]|nr:DUF1272 domain-containing protein [Tateyamaria omphalii]